MPVKQDKVKIMCRECPNEAVWVSGNFRLCESCVRFLIKHLPTLKKFEAQMRREKEESYAS